MKQILQNLGDGETSLVEASCPQRSEGKILVETTKTLVSLGTEKMLLDFGKGSLLEKARLQPDKVKQVLQKVKTDGFMAAVDAVKSKLSQPIPLGYCNVGVVTGGAQKYPEGARVASNGNHSEVVSVPDNLCARIPDEVSDESAAFTVVGAIGLQGVRLLEPTLGEKVVVMGLGLIGLLTVQVLKANGCQVLGVDLDPEKCALAKSFGAEVCDLSKGGEALVSAEEFSDGHGVDGVLITASAKTDRIVHEAATMCRKRGRIVLVGVVGLKLQRDDFYKKELSFQVSCSYGPGRYDPQYEAQGIDYPRPFVRWTEQRNLEAVLSLMAEGKIITDPLVSHRFPFDDALEAYEVVGSGQALGIILDYGAPQGADSPKFARTIEIQSANNSLERPGVSFIGAGNFTARNLLPAVEKVGGVCLRTIVSKGGASSGQVGRQFGFEKVGSDVAEVFKDSKTDVVFVTTAHNSHAGYVLQALEAGKHVFVEKPLALHEEELDEIEKALSVGKGGLLMVGFNRRFSPHTVQMKNWLESAPGAKSIVITVNAGAIPKGHWTQDPEVGGGRILGEACHFIDLARHLAGSPIESVHSARLGGVAGQTGDSVVIYLSFADGSIASIQYLATGHKSYPKERVEVFAGGRVIQCDNFRVTRGWGVGGGCKTRRQDKGHVACVRAFLDAVREGADSPVAADELLEISRATISAAAIASD